MNTTIAERVPSAPTEEVVREAPAPQLPAEVQASHERMRQKQEQHPGVPLAFLADKPFGEVVGAIAAVMVDLHPVEKGGTNSFHNYKYARMQDILQMLTPLMGKHGLVVFQYERRHQMFDDGKVMAITYDFVVAHKSGQTWLSEVPQTGMSPCRTSKGTFDDKATAKCHTSARKYFLLSLFQIPTEDENDPDNEKRPRGNTPVPSPDGHVAPHAIEPGKRETFESWSAKYLAFARKAKTVAELDRWDELNDDFLSQMDASDKGKPIYAALLKDFEALRARFGVQQEAAPAQQTGTPVQHSNPVSNPSDPTFYDKAAAYIDANDAPPRAAEPFVRPEGCPDANREPDAFLKWADVELKKIESPEQLDIYWREVIDPASDGITTPDYAELQGLLRKTEQRLGG